MRPARIIVALFTTLTLTATVSRAQAGVLHKGPELERLDVFAGSWEGSLERFLPNGTLSVSLDLEVSWDVGGPRVRNLPRPGTGTQSLGSRDRDQEKPWAITSPFSAA